MRRGAGRLLLILVVALIGWAGTAAVAILPLPSIVTISTLPF